MSTRNNVKVVCRFRPPNKLETSLADPTDPKNRTIDVVAQQTVKMTNQGHALNFTFDRVFVEDSKQKEVFEATAAPLVDEVMLGFNTTIFVYGQTGSGKTHTMMGARDKDPELAGIIPRIVETIFDQIAAADPAIKFTVKASYVEIYNEMIRDLLNKEKTNLKIREGGGGVWIEDVTETYVTSFDETLRVMDKGLHARAVASTLMNAESSRSHSVFIVTVGQDNTVTGSKRGAKLILVDLAGSEKVEKTGAAGSTLKEAQNINKSLSALGNVINALTSGGKKHVPYRDSKLTRLLSDSLGGNSKTCLVITASGHIYNKEETIATLRFGIRAKAIQNKAKANQQLSVAEYQALLAIADQKIELQAAIIASLEVDVSALLACLKAVKPEHLVVPIPALGGAKAKAAAEAALAKTQDGEPAVEAVEEEPSDAVSPPADEPDEESTPVESASDAVSSGPTAMVDNFVDEAKEAAQPEPAAPISDELKATADYVAFTELQIKYRMLEEAQEKLKFQLEDREALYEDQQRELQATLEEKEQMLQRLQAELDDAKLQQGSGVVDGAASSSEADAAREKLQMEVEELTLFKQRAELEKEELAKKDRLNEERFAASKAREAELQRRIEELEAAAAAAEAARKADAAAEEEADRKDEEEQAKSEDQSAPLSVDQKTLKQQKALERQQYRNNFRKGKVPTAESIIGESEKPMAAGGETTPPLRIKSDPAAFSSPAVAVPRTMASPAPGSAGSEMIDALTDSNVRMTEALMKKCNQVIEQQIAMDAQKDYSNKLEMALKVAHAKNLQMIKELQEHKNPNKALQEYKSKYNAEVAQVNLLKKEIDLLKKRYEDDAQSHGHTVRGGGSRSRGGSMALEMFSPMSSLPPNHPGSKASAAAAAAAATSAWAKQPTSAAAGAEYRAVAQQRNITAAARAAQSSNNMAKFF